MHHAVIMAGGSGTRLWPLSRRSHPKQLLRIFEGKSLLRRSFDRLRALLPAEQIHIITGRDYIEPMAAELPELPRENLMGEPCPRDTANAVGLAAHLLALRDPDGTMGIFTADHIIHPIDTFAATVRQGFEAADRHADALITFGITPRNPHTGYGYIHRGPQVDPGVFEVLEFKEKPDLETARRYVESGEYYWNSGMFVWRLPAIIAQIRKHQPQIDAGLREVAAGFHDPARADAILARFSSLPKISIDFAVMEKADRVLTVEMPCEWLDVGSWPSLAEVFKPDEAGNILAAPNVMTLDARDNILVSESDHLFAAIGVSDLIVIHSDDATLICRKQDAQRIKDLVQQARQTTGERYM
ncbi:MAG TPA: mannose-1-phosphate guanylyltransferase [Phycisphaerae bacterium]|nr:mannose-1-phosphate guanylyltransferase [Phycisphaerae bacterium]HRR85743.1 mannose-1-phosphate guanylyltransferase [Phycisphaerae bacterium]